MKHLIDLETLAAEVRLAAKKKMSFKRFMNGLRIDYRTEPLETPERLKKLEYAYNTCLFITEERTNRYSTAC